MGFVLLGCKGLEESMGGTLGGEDTHCGWDRTCHGNGTWKEPPRKPGDDTLTTWLGLCCVLCPHHLINCVAGM